MKVRRYFAANMRSALEQVRQAQGPDVVILSNRKVEGGVELLTAIGQPDSELLEKFTPRPARARVDAGADAARPPPVNESTFRPVPVTTATEPSLWTGPETVIQMQRELGALKSLLEQQLSGLAWSDFDSRSPLRARLLRQLAQFGIAPRLGRSLVAEVDERQEFPAAWSALLAALEQRLPCLDDPVLRHGGYVALCGGTGVGKTTLASKLAGRYALAHGSDQVALLSCDDQRLGAHQQLRTFGRLVGIGVRVVPGLEALPEALAEFRDCGLVIIDVPGFAPSDPAFRGTLEALAGMPDPIDAYLTLSASTDYLAMERVVAAVAGLPLEGCCLTKLDEAASLGAALSAVIAARLPVAYVTHGQQVPDDFSPVTPAGLVAQMVSMGRANPCPDESAYLEQAFAS